MRFFCCGFIFIVLFLHRLCAQDTVAVYSGIAPADSVIINTITVSGNNKTKAYIILRELPFKTGSRLPAEAINKQLLLARERLINTSLFVDANVTAIREDTSINIRIVVKERWYLLPVPYFKLVDRNFNQWWVEQHHSFERVNYGLKLIQNNVIGRNENAYLWLITGYNRQIAFRYEQPFADKALKNGFSTAFSFSRQREVNYATTTDNKQLFYRGNDFIKKQFRIEGSYLYRPGIKMRHNLTLKLIDEQIADTVRRLNRNYFPAGKKHLTYPVFNYTLQYLDADNYVYPIKGFIGDVLFTKKGLGRDMNLWQLELHSKYTIPVLPKTQIQLQAAGIINAPFKQPFVNSQLMNYYGDIFMRGLEYYVIDGVASGVVRGTIRQQLLTYTIKNPVAIKNHEYIPVRFFLKAYTDAGYVYNNHVFTSALNNKLIKTWGVGLDVVTIYDVVIKLEYSLNQFNNRSLYLHSRADF